MDMKHDHLRGIVYITLPASMEQDIGNLHINPSIPLPVQLPDGQEEIGSDGITIEMIVAAMIKIVAWQPENKFYSYYKDFILAAQPDCVEELNIAAIAKEKGKNYDFSEELFLAVNHLLPQSTTYINLATHYSTRATAEKEAGNSETFDLYQQKALDTLKEGTERFPENPDLLREIGYFHVYQNNIDTARDYLEKYLEFADEDDKQRKHVSHLLDDIHSKISNDTKLLQSYDEIQLCHEEKALELLNEYLKENPKLWNAHFLKGWALRRLERFDEARESFYTCLKLGQKNGEIYNELAICTLECGERELAKTYLNTAIDLDKGNIKLLSNLAYLCLKDKEYDMARKLLENARAVDQRDPVVIQLSKDYCSATGDRLSDPIIEEVVDNETLKEAEKHQEEHQGEDKDECVHQQQCK
jgi:Flp pilus assembly protein TadD